MKKVFLLLIIGLFIIISCGEDDNSTPSAGDSCKAGEKRCRGNKLDSCKNNKWELETDCLSNHQICNSSKLMCVAKTTTCSKGEVECHENILEICNPEFKWEKLKDCNIHNETCNAEHLSCEQADCEVGKVRCVNNNLEVCDTHKGWFQHLNCTEHNQTCNVEKAKCE